MWKSYAYTRNQRIQQLSPFEVDVLGPLFRDTGSKLRHKIEVSRARVRCGGEGAEDERRGGPCGALITANAGPLCRRC